jgi:hypothetical protein
VELFTPKKKKTKMINIYTPPEKIIFFVFLFRRSLITLLSFLKHEVVMSLCVSLCVCVCCFLSYIQSTEMKEKLNNAVQLFFLGAFTFLYGNLHNNERENSESFASILWNKQRKKKDLFLFFSFSKIRWLRVLYVFLRDES